MDTPNDNENPTPQAPLTYAQAEEENTSYASLEQRYASYNDLQRNQPKEA